MRWIEGLLEPFDQLEEPMYGDASDIPCRRGRRPRYNHQLPHGAERMYEIPGKGDFPNPARPLR